MGIAKWVSDGIDSVRDFVKDPKHPHETAGEWYNKLADKKSGGGSNPGVPQLSSQFIADSEEKRRRRLRQMALGAFGKSDTIATSPLGLVDEPSTGRKTLLGA